MDGGKLQQHHGWFVFLRFQRECCSDKVCQLSRPRAHATAVQRWTRSNMVSNAAATQHPPKQKLVVQSEACGGFTSRQCETVPIEVEHPWVRDFLPQSPSGEPRNFQTERTNASHSCLLRYVHSQLSPPSLQFPLSRSLTDAHTIRSPLRNRSIPCFVQPPNASVDSFQVHHGDLVSAS